MLLSAETSECWSQKTGVVSKTRMLVSDSTSLDGDQHHHTLATIKQQHQTQVFLSFTCKLLEHANEVKLPGVSFPYASQPAKEQPRSFANEAILDCSAEAGVQTGKTHHCGYKVYFSLSFFHCFSVSFQNITAA